MKDLRPGIRATWDFTLALLLLDQLPLDRQAFLLAAHLDGQGGVFYKFQSLHGPVLADTELAFFVVVHGQDLGCG